MADLDQVSRLVRDALDRFDAPEMTVAAMLRRCQRIAALRGDAANLHWLSMEGDDLTLKIGPNVNKSLGRKLFDDLLPEDRALASEKLDAYMARRDRPATHDIYGGSIEMAETALEQIDRELDSLSQVPDGMHPQDLGLRLLRADKARTKYLEVRRSFESVITNTKAALWEFLLTTEYQLTFGEATTETFQRLRSYVDRQLTVLAPPALDQFQSAYRRLSEGSPEARAQAVTSCRRVLKTLADQLFQHALSPTLASTAGLTTSRTMTSSTAWSRTSPKLFSLTGTARRFALPSTISAAESTRCSSYLAKAFTTRSVSTRSIPVWFRPIL